jgi:hypothetical protein
MHQDQNTLAYIDTSKKGDGDVYAGNISFLEQNEMVYSPVTMAYGTGYYAKNPVVYNSKLKREDEPRIIILLHVAMVRGLDAPPDRARLCLPKGYRRRNQKPAEMATKGLQLLTHKWIQQNQHED